MDVVDFSRYAGGLLITLALMFVALLAAKRLMSFAGRRGGASSEPRLSIVETLPLDPKRRLAVVRWGEAEHLVLLGHAGEARRIASRPTPPRFDDALAAVENEPSTPEPAAPADIGTRLSQILARTPRFDAEAGRRALSPDDVRTLLEPHTAETAR